MDLMMVRGYRGYLVIWFELSSLGLVRLSCKFAREAVDARYNVVSISDVA